MFLSRIVDWLAGLHIGLVLVIALMISPGNMFLLGWVGESRTIPVWDNQWRSLIVGDPCLAVSFTAAIWLTRSLPEKGWWYSSFWQTAVLLAVFGAFIWWRYFWDGKNYLPAELWSPTKIYHDVVLIIGYGYMMVFVLTPALLATGWGAGQLAARVILLCSVAAWLYTILIWDGRRQGEIDYSITHTGWDLKWVGMAFRHGE